MASSGTPQPRSRPGSAMGYLNGNSSGNGGSSRPGTPSSLQRPDPYTGSITVLIRPNPFSVNHNGQPPTWELGLNTISNTQDQTSFTFDNVYLADKSVTSNLSVYQDSCAHIVNKFLYEGFNGTVFAYGMTGSGKTYSMRGHEEDPGFVKLAIDDIFQMIDNDALEKSFKLTVTYLEIYNEKIIDLLGDLVSGNVSDLKIRDDSVYGNKIIGITSPDIVSKDQLLLLIKRGDNNRKTSATDFNARSSRSHSILQLKLNTVDALSNTDTHSVLSLCDLAGSERATSSLERRKEGAFINKSLLALSTVINKLSASSTSPTLASASAGGSTDHIPYRDSKLTRLLQPALSGSSLISILCTIHLGSGNDTPSLNNQFISETYNTLRFAARARNIVMNVNKSRSTFIDSADSLKLIEDLKRTIETQKSEIHQLKHTPSTNTTSSFNNSLGSGSGSDLKVSQLESENAILNEKLEHLTRLTDLQKTETIILKNDILNDLLGSGIDNNALQVMMANLEEFYKRVNYEMDEHKSYIHHLENQLKSAHQQISLSLSKVPPQQQTSQFQSQPQSLSLAMDLDLDAVLKDQEEEIWHLKELIKDKDHIIKSLTKTSKLRRLMESNSANLTESEGSDKRPIVRLAEGGKENSFNEMKSFKIGGRRSPERS